jgi:hypothetical protein
MSRADEPPAQRCAGGGRLLRPVIGAPDNPEMGTRHRITHWHRTLTVLAIGLLALAAALVA